MNSNEPHGRVTLQARFEDRQLSIVIGNTGPGISKEDQPRLFERFFRGTLTVDQRPDGMGLGLSLAGEIIRGHGGEIALEDSRVGWTCFKIELRQEALG